MKINDLQLYLATGTVVYYPAPHDEGKTVREKVTRLVWARNSDEAKDKMIREYEWSGWDASESVIENLEVTEAL